MEQRKFVAAHQSFGFCKKLLCMEFFASSWEATVMRKLAEEFRQVYGGYGFRQRVGISAGREKVTPRGLQCLGAFKKSGAELRR
jgi:hypothetical protein